jgi:hypothetical protein
MMNKIRVSFREKSIPNMQISVFNLAKSILYPEFLARLAKYPQSTSHDFTRIL